jgi:mRNA-degrading endonuclease RelE of RelBE toxin-antitoxin system
MLSSEQFMSWQVFFSKRAEKQLTKLPENIISVMLFLTREIELKGPMQHAWKNFGKLQGFQNRYHCHLKNGRPTYVACWEVKDKEIRIIEVYYVGTHEQAPY